MSYAGSSNHRAVPGIGFEEKEHLDIHRQEGHQAPLADATLLGINLPPLDREPLNK